jgi:hypothetical protein
VVKQTTPLVQRTRDMLQGLYGPANLRKMGEHGFTVNDPSTPTKS